VPEGSPDARFRAE